MKPGVVAHVCIPVLQGLRQKDLKCEATLGYLWIPAFGASLGYLWNPAFWGGGF